jgi:hypothetical protein
VLTDRSEPMHVRDIHAAVEALVSEPVPLSSIKGRLAEQNIGSYRLAASTRGTRAVLLNTQKCLRVCADISLLDPPPAVTPLLPGARWAAGSFAALCSLDAVDPVEEANATMATLYATP